MSHNAVTRTSILSKKHRIWLEAGVKIHLDQASRSLIQTLRIAYKIDPDCLQMDAKSRTFLFEFEGFEDRRGDAEEPLQFGLEGELLNHWDL